MAGTTLWFEHGLTAAGWARGVRISVADGRIARLETGVEADGAERHGIAVPGLPNLHSHAFQRAMAGLTEVRGPAGDSFWTWRELMYRFGERLGPEELEAVAALAFAEMLERGFTRVGEFHYLHHDEGGRPFADPAEMSARIAAAAQATGIGLTLLPVFYAHSGFGGAAPTPAQARFVHDPDGYGRLVEAARLAVRPLGDAVVGVAPHSLRAVTEDELRAVADLGDGPVHIHIAEQVREVDDCLAWSGARPVEWLLDRFGVGEAWCLVHATHMTAEETRRLARSGAVAGLCPVTEANLGDGIFPADAYLADGGRFGVGSDSNVRIDAAEELRMLEYSQRLGLKARNVLARGEGSSTGADLFRGALTGGARALGVPAAEGLAEGGPADIVALSADHPDLAGRSGDQWLDSWVFAAGGAAVADVWRAGEHVVQGGRHRARDGIEARYRQALARLTA
ncbi:formimidoylglutamate deiminase [Phenylobacterium sp.]|uniref:formimidoylglutamate deiminase n=1 Tax=Phenylobacterium sp. TaxID=1871053 RepID=UPI002C9D5B6C|nr:formimidoylglutamate deiminase [Phenylobacterium sp.]HVI33989.1 formimidoylglutamate deiminase [Phenylobacterium sp.]